MPNIPLGNITAETMITKIRELVERVPEDDGPWYLVRCQGIDHRIVNLGGGRFRCVPFAPRKKTEGRIEEVALFLFNLARENPETK